MGVGGSPRATASGSALCAARVWPVCGTRRRVDSGKSDVRPRWRAGPKNVALFLAKMYHSGKNSKPKVERGIFPALRTQSGGPQGSQTGSKRGQVQTGPATRCPGAPSRLCPSLALGAHAGTTPLPFLPFPWGVSVMSPRSAPL